MTTDDQTPARTTLAAEAIPLLLDDDTMRIAAERIRQGVDAEIVCRLIRATYEGRRQADAAAAAARIAELERSLSIADALYNGAVDTIAELEAQVAASHKRESKMEIAWADAVSQLAEYHEGGNNGE